MRRDRLCGRCACMLLCVCESVCEARATQGFRITFHFDPNIYFTNAELSKTCVVAPGALPPPVPPRALD